MGKRSGFTRIARDNYQTPFEAVAPLLPWLAPQTRFIEPCAGAGVLVGHLKRAGHVLAAAHDLLDDARSYRYPTAGVDAFVTNPPWSRDVLHPIIANLSDQAPTWLLIDADWAHTRQAIPFLPRLRMIVSVGRVRWIPDTPYDGKDNCAWHLFDRPDAAATIRFVGRQVGRRGRPRTDSDRRPAQELVRPIAVDLFCGLGGWAEGLLAEGWDVYGFDIEQHRYPGQLVIQDVRTVRGSQFETVDLIVASPPCQEYSYMAMPWRRAKQIAAALQGQAEFPEGYTGSRTIAELNELFDACFRIQNEASDAARRHIPMIVENVQGACPWVGRSRWNFGSYHLWGDVPALMPQTLPRDGRKVAGFRFDGRGQSFQSASVRRVEEAGRKAASALIAKIPFPLARHMGRVFKPKVFPLSSPASKKGAEADGSLRADR